MARPEKPIPHDAPAKQLAEYLRDLRRRAGNPPYRNLAKLVFCGQNVLSKTANGRPCKWHSVQRYAEALNRYHRDTVTLSDVAELRRLYQLAEHVSRRPDHRPEHQPTTAAGTYSDAVEVELLWREIRSSLVDTASNAATTRAPGQWHLTPLGQLPTLSEARTIRDLLACLRQVATSHGLYARAANRRRSPGLYPPRPDDHALIADLDALSHDETATLDVAHRVVAHCGGTEGDQLAWTSAWQRAQNTPCTSPTLELPIITSRRPSIWKRLRLARPFRRQPPITPR